MSEVNLYLCRSRARGLLLRLKVTCWTYGTDPSPLKRGKAWSRQIGDTRSSVTDLRASGAASMCAVRLEISRTILAVLRCSGIVLRNHFIAPSVGGWRGVGHRAPQPCRKRGGEGRGGAQHREGQEEDESPHLPAGQRNVQRESAAFIH